MLAALIVIASSQPLPFYVRAREIAIALPPPGPWSCEALARHTYCCPKDFKVRWDGKTWTCTNQLDKALTRPAVVLARFKGDSQ